MNPADLKALFGREPAEAVRYLEQKGYKLGWNWQDTLGAAHARAFTVAKVARLDLLQDIHQAVAAAAREGLTEAQFIARLTPVLQAKGWWGRQEHIDTDTGEITQVQLGSPRRLKTIYRTNLQSAYMAGRYQAMQEAAASHPYWQYVAVLDGRTRPSHRAMNGRVFRHDDPVWASVYPPNGFGCRCRVRSLRGKAVEREGLTVESSAGRLVEVQRPVGKEASVTVTGLRVKGLDGKPVLFAPDAGFGFNPGASWQAPFTPPPLDSLPRTFPAGVALPALPKPTPFPAAKLLPAGLTEEQYVEAFLSEFEAGLGVPRVYFDVKDEPLLLNAELFKDGKGRWKVKKEGRERYLPALAMVIKEPDEIWLRWEESRSKPGQWLLKRRYLKAFVLDDETFGVGAFELGDDGWTGSTLFQTSQKTLDDRRAYFSKQRDGFLLYKSRDEVKP